MFTTRAGSSSVAAARNSGRSAWVSVKTAFRFTAITLSQPVSEYWSMGSAQAAPALLIRMSSLVSRDFSASASLCTSAVSPRSWASAMQVPVFDSSAAAASQAEALRDEM